MAVNIWRTTVVGLLASASLLAAACGSDRGGGITAPSTITAPAASVSAPSAATANRVVALDHGSDGDEVEGEAPVTSLVAGTSCPALTFMIGDFRISVTSATIFEGGTCADIKPGARLEVKGIKTGTSVAASKIEFRDRPLAPGVNEPMEGEGTVTSVTAGTACPTLTFQVGTFTVMLTATTLFEHGTCADVKVGTRLEVTGTIDRTTNTITASKVEIKVQNAVDDNEPAEGEDAVTSIVAGTSCPTLQFMIGTFLIKLDANTVFDKGSCADIKVGTRVHVKGVLSRTTSSVVASRVSVQNRDQRDVEGEARVTSLVSGTACPALTFRIEEWTISVDASTMFTGGSCADIAAGRRIAVKGLVIAEHTVTASSITFKAS